jgi:DNA-binding transcriptional LysR family regulator
MLDGIDALVALHALGTVSEAGARLRLTQSAVSKRLQALQASLGFALVERDGRRLRLTAPAIAFVERARPLVAELRDAARPAAAPAARATFTLALADSVAASWGPALVRRALDALPGTRVELHAHRSVLVIESLRLGRYDAGLCAEPSAAGDLVHHPLVDEPMVLVRGRAPGRGGGAGEPLITIEPTSATWRAIEPMLRARHPELLARPRIAVESFGAVLQMARSGFGDGLVPAGLVDEARLGARARRALPGVVRRVALLTRKTVHQLAGFAALRAALAAAATAVGPRWAKLRG